MPYIKQLKGWLVDLFVNHRLKQILAQTLEAIFIGLGRIYYLSHLKFSVLLECHPILKFLLVWPS